jgi:hypothetical protein
MKRHLSLASALLAAALPVCAATGWTDWTSATPGAPGSASGTLNGVAVNYSGQVLGNTVVNGSAGGLWAPSASFAGGTVTTGPASVGDVITLNGGFTGTHTITFATPVVDPVFAIWSLGQPGLAASFTFDAAPTLQAGGPNASFGGQSITVSGSTVSGFEGNGVLQFNGSFSSISWTDTPENYYGFSIGMSGAVTAIPEPATWGMLLLGLAGLGIVRRYAKR